MIYPAAMFIEAAEDMLKSISDEDKSHQRQELFAACGDRATGAFGDGYLLGLQTARVILMGSVRVAQARINAQDLL